MRRALFWAQGGDFAPPSGLHAYGWHVEAAGDLPEPQSGPNHEKCEVGLAAFDPAQVPLSAVQEMVLAKPSLEWIALIPPNSIHHGDVKKAIGDTFFDYHTLPVQPELLAACMGHAAGMAGLRHRADWGTDEGRGEFSMVGRSPQMSRLYRAVSRIAATDAPVLICGETGTGKELVARAIHDASARRAAPFVALNCGALPETLIQAELFGYEKGAFTDAKTRHIGRIEAATAGTLFLDEVGDLPASVQAVLLRFLQEKTIERLGGVKLIPLDVRVLAATHIDLERLISGNRFREDLYYRLNVLRIEVPPLRHRQGDIELLANSMLQKFASRAKRRIRGFSCAALDWMNFYEWPGNVRELINRVQRAAVMCEGRLVSVADLGFERRTSPRSALKLASSRKQAEQEAIRDALARFRTMTQASAELGISRMTLYRLMAKYGMTRDGSSEAS